jgi:hypothetical protein
MAETSRVAELVAAVAADPDLRTRLAQAPEQERAGIIAELGFSDVSAADVMAYQQTLAKAGTVEHELDSSELDIVTGGLGHQNTVVSDAAFIVE